MMGLSRIRLVNGASGTRVVVDVEAGDYLAQTQLVICVALEAGEVARASLRVTRPGSTEVCE
jgi:hypothetical protein